ncbi:MAG: hypothetical protein U0796_00255 [Gemmatales bacterium]
MAFATGQDAEEDGGGGHPGGFRRRASCGVPGTMPRSERSAALLCVPL